MKDISWHYCVSNCRGELHPHRALLIYHVTDSEQLSESETGLKFTQ
jgi:hypothetical protein